MQSLCCKCAFLWHVNISICHKSNGCEKALSPGAMPMQCPGNALAIPQFVRSYGPGQKECRNQNFNIMFMPQQQRSQQNRTELSRGEQSRADIELEQMLYLDSLDSCSIGPNVLVAVLAVVALAVAVAMFDPKKQ